MEKAVIYGDLIELKKEHADEAAKLMCTNFIKNNAVWMSLRLDQSEAQKHFKKIVLKHVESQERIKRQLGSSLVFNHVNFQDGKINGVLFHYELHEYCKVRKQPSFGLILPNIAKFEEIGDELMKAADLTKYQKGKHAFCSFGVIDKSVPHKLKSQRNLAIARAYRNFRNNGFRSTLTRVSNQVSVFILKNVVAEILSEVELISEGNAYKFTLLEIKFDNPALRQVFDLLNHYEDNTKSEQTKAKL